MKQELFEKKCCQNRVLTLFANILSMLFRKQYRQRFLTGEWTAIGFRNHTKLLQALQDGAPEEFRALIIAHINPT